MLIDMVVLGRENESVLVIEKKPTRNILKEYILIMRRFIKQNNIF